MGFGFARSEDTFLFLSFSVLNPKMVQPDIEVAVLSKDVDKVRGGGGLKSWLRCRNPGWHPNPGHWSPST